MSISDLRVKLDDALVQAEQDMKDSHKLSPNSYGAGYDCGWRDALKTVLNTINGEEDNVLP